MIKRILNTGNYPENGEILNRKIRVSNLIAFITLIVMFSYLPITLIYHYAGDLVLNFSFISISFLHLFLQKKRKHALAFYITTTFGFIYFIVATRFYGLSANLHFFMLVMCMIVLVLFDKPYVIKGYLLLALLSFFGLIWFMDGKPGIIEFTADLQKVQAILAQLNLFLLFIITCVFMFYFKNDNLEFQEKIIQQKEIIEEKSKDITDSITYAKRLQEAILPSQNFMKEQLPGSFVFYVPKDIVAGDFYWMERKGELLFFAACDCTGHGVPGALVSVICSNALNRAVNEFGLTEPGRILDKVRQLVVETFDKSGSDVRDGMDISLCCYNKVAETLQWSGANNPLVLIRDKELTELKPDKQPIGRTESLAAFKTHTMKIKEGDQIFLFTDGFSDQFGGPKGKKFKYSHLKEILLSASDLSVNDQKSKLEGTLRSWKGDLEQVDDILVMGVRF